MITVLRPPLAIRSRDDLGQVFRLRCHAVTLRAFASTVKRSVVVAGQIRDEEDENDADDDKKNPGRTHAALRAARAIFSGSTREPILYSRVVRSQSTRM
jgi:hypothetical protein